MISLLITNSLIINNIIQTTMSSNIFFKLLLQRNELSPTQGSGYHVDAPVRVNIRKLFDMNPDASIGEFFD